MFEDSEWPKALRNDRKDLFKLDRKHFFDMIKPTPYPDDYPPLQKIDRIKESAASLDIEDLPVYKLPLYVTFEDKIKNHVGVPQPRCTACGNCISGCNVGSKNTLNMNYLPDAKAHGAELFTEVLSNRINTGAHNHESLFTMYFYHGDFRDRVIFRHTQELRQPITYHFHHFSYCRG